MVAKASFLPGREVYLKLATFPAGNTGSQEPQQFERKPYWSTAGQEREWPTTFGVNRFARQSV